MKELAVYIHIPFCVSKCIYCNFVSFCANENQINSYFIALEKEIIAKSGEYKDFVITTLFIGGGTPSVVKAEKICSIVNLIKKLYNVNLKEFTIEINPNSITREKLENYKSIGVNRLSIGLQSSNDKLLKMLNRPHKKQDFINAISLAKDIGFENINADILIDIPNQSIDSLVSTLDFVINLDVTHISAYGLIVEENTKLKTLIDKNELCAIDEDLAVKMYDKVVAYLKKYGYDRYEVSNFCKKGFQCIHNLKYWQNEDYLGFGVASHSKIGNERFCHTDNFELYLQNPNKYESSYSLSYEENYEERIMLSLRKTTGIDIEKINNEFNLDFLVLKKCEIDFLIENKLIKIKDNHLFATLKGFKVLNYVIDWLT